MEDEDEYNSNSNIERIFTVLTTRNESNVMLTEAAMDVYESFGKLILTSVEKNRSLHWSNFYQLVNREYRKARNASLVPQINSGERLLLEQKIYEHYVIEAQLEVANVIKSEMEELANVKPTNEEDKMDSNKLVEKITFVKGINIKQMTDDALYKIIAEAEEEIRVLNMVKRAPKKLKEKIKVIESDIALIVDYIDRDVEA